jgi:hypothetical protein
MDIHKQHQGMVIQLGLVVQIAQMKVVVLDIQVKLFRGLIIQHVRNLLVIHKLLVKDQIIQMKVVALDIQVKLFRGLIIQHVRNLLVIHKLLVDQVIQAIVTHKLLDLYIQEMDTHKLHLVQVILEMVIPKPQKKLTRLLSRALPIDPNHHVNPRVHDIHRVDRGQVTVVIAMLLIQVLSIQGLNTLGQLIQSQENQILVIQIQEVVRLHLVVVDGHRDPRGVVSPHPIALGLPIIHHIIRMINFCVFSLAFFMYTFFIYFLSMSFKGYVFLFSNIRFFFFCIW